MTSPTGNESARCTHGPGRGIRAFTFVELMLTVVILSVGVVMIYRSYFISLNVLNHFKRRVVAMNLCDDKLARLEYDFRAQQKLPSPENESQSVETLKLNDYTFDYFQNISNLEGLTGVQEVDWKIAWQEGKRHIELNSSALISSSISFPAYF